MPKTTVLLPAYNEEAQIKELIEAINISFEDIKSPYQILLVDDGSSDRTVDFAKTCKKIKIIEHVENKGLGEAMKTGINHFLDQSEPGEVLVAMDADNTHDPELIKEMLPMIQYGYDLVIASRYQKGAKVVGLSLFRQLLSIGASLFFRLLHPIKNVKDYSCGYRAYSRESLMSLRAKYGQKIIESQGFSCMVELLLKLKSINAKCDEVPLVLRYDKKLSSSKIQIFKTIVNTVILAFSKLFARN